MSSGISIPIGGDLAPFVHAINELRSDFSKLSAHSSQNFEKVSASGKHAASSIRSAFAGLKGVIPINQMMGDLTKFYTIQGTIMTAFNAIKGTIHGASDYEDMVVKMEQFAGSAEKAREIMDEIAKFSLSTPFSGGPLRESAASLLQAGLPAARVPAITKDIAAVSDNPEQIADFTTAMAKGFDKGQVKLKELNGFLTAHVDILSAIGEQLGLNKEKTLETVREGVKFNVVAAALHSMSQEGGQFYGLLERKSSTYAGLMQRLENAWNGVKRSFVMPMLEGLAPFLDYARDKITSLKATAAEAGESIKNAMFGAFAVVREGRIGEALGTGIRLAAAQGIDGLMRGVTGVLAFITTALPPVFSAAMAVFSDPNFWAGLGNAFRGVGLMAAVEIEKVLPGMDKMINNAGDTLEYATRSFIAWTQKDKGDGHGGMTPEETAAYMDFPKREGAGQQKMLDFSKLYLDLAGLQLNKVQSGDMAKAGAAGLVAGGREFLEVMEKWEPSAAVTEAKKAWQDMMDSVSTTIDSLKEKFAVPEPKPGTGGRGVDDGSGDSAEKEGKAFSAPMVLTTALGRIGGGGFGMTFMPMLGEQRVANTLLKKVVEHTGKMASNLTPVKPIV